MPAGQLTGAVPTTGEAAASPPGTLTALLAVMMIVSALPLTLLGVLAALILPDLAMTRSEMGLALSLVTAVGGVLSLGAGHVTDAVGGRVTLRLSFLLGAMALGTIAIASSYPWLLLAMGLTGVVHAFSNPSTNWVIATNYPPARRGFATGIKQSGVQAALFLSGVALPPIAQVAGWRAAVGSLVVIPLLGVIGTAVVPRDRRPRGPWRGRGGRVRHPATIRWLAAYSLMAGIGQSSVLSFVPLYANESVGLSLSAAGAAGAVVGLLGVASRITWTGRAERFGSMTTPLSIITGGSIVVAASLLGAAELGAPALWLAVVVAGGTLAASNAVVQLATVVAAPAGTTGRASALVIVFFLTGNTIGPAAFGWLVDRSGDYLAGWLMVLLAFLVAMTLLRLWSRSERTSPG